MLEHLEHLEPLRLSVFELLNELQFDRGVDIAFVMRFCQKFADSVTTNVAVIAREFVDVHSDEPASEFCIHVAGVGKRVLYRLLPVR